ncbi:restriction endonuclease subunit S [Pedobacter miscanthi]|uniref:restriction endonuclease subunit S n=1 Tax=Pedobacter miscanthi TaxID=2259170 RepID=UPI001ABF68C0|nr:restriction endonuclease subunit S [Pedobacter miscanthi]
MIYSSGIACFPGNPIDLEIGRITRLKKYLLETGLNNYVLAPEEENALIDFPNEKFQDFSVVDVFHVRNTKNILYSDIIENSGDIPYLCASADNNAVSSYISYDPKYLDKGNCVFIGGKTFVVTYQENDFYSNDSHNLVLDMKEEKKKNKLNQLYLATCIEKSLGYKYSWGDSISKSKIRSDVVSLPAANNKPKYELMNVFASAINKLVIKRVIQYVDKKIDSSEVFIIITNQKINASHIK